MERGPTVREWRRSQGNGVRLPLAATDPLREPVQSRAVGMVIVAKLARLTRSVTVLAILLEQFRRRGVSLVWVAESLDTGRLVLNIMASVSEWEREAIGEQPKIGPVFGP
jgi:hypothetical protein